jgi:CheY-like chemotaxis protein
MPYGRVLVVDDVSTNLDVAKGLMLPYGLTIDCVSSGQAAIDKIRDEKVRYDVIFMDHMMPGMDGIEAVRIIRSEIGTDYAKTIPIIALSANALAGNEKMFLSNGFDDFIPKPIDLQRLNTLLNLWIRDRHGGESSAGPEPVEAPPAGDNSGLPRIKTKEFAVMEELNWTAGLDRYEEEDIYLRILRSYSVHTPELLEKLRSLSRETLADYAVTVHGLKGASYGICADGIGKKAEELEYAAKAGNYEKVAADNEAFTGRVEKFLADLAALLEKNTKTKTEKPLAPAPDASLLGKILEASIHFKPRVMEESLVELEKYNYETGGELVSWLREQIDNLEYDAVQKRLETELGQNNG